MTARTDVGIAHSTPPTAVFSLAPNDFHTMLVMEGQDDDLPEDVDARIRRHRAANDPRQFAVVVGGGHDFLARYQSELSEPDVLVLCGTEAELHDLGVPIFDEGWDQGKPTKGTLTAHLNSSRKRRRRR